jgi:hypothetical protein
MIKILGVMMAAGLLAGCAQTPPSQAEQADLAACTAAADDTYKAQNYDQLSRTSQTGVLYSATPTAVFNAQQMGAMHARDSQITNCVRNGHNDTSTVIPGPPPVTPHIIQ